MVNPRIIFQDDALLVLDKPAGWIVNKAGTTENQPVLQTWLAETFNYPLAKSREERSGIVHRLDKETSGILLIAKTKEAFKNLQLQFKEREVHKVYVALVHGKIEPPEGEIRASVGRLPWNRERFGVVVGGREAITKYKVIGVYKLQTFDYSLVEVNPMTGRTHQVRVHFKYIGHPIVSDTFYSGRKTSKRDRSWCPRLFLHASRISFKHPVLGREIAFESQLSPDLSSSLKKLTRVNL